MESLFFIDTNPQAAQRDKRKAAWKDEDAPLENMMIIDDLPKWARKEEAPTAESIIRSHVDPSALAQRSKLKLVRSLDANVPIKSVLFHPTLDVCAILEGSTIKIFNLAAPENDLLATILVDDFYPSSFAFIDGGNSLAICGNKPFVVLYCLKRMKSARLLLPAGYKSTSLVTCSPDQKTWAFTDGGKKIFLVKSVTNQIMKTFFTAETIQYLSFSAGSSQLVSCGNHGAVYIWDLKTYTCLKKFHDEGGPSCTAVAMSESLLAVGSNLGIVNIYETNNGVEQADKLAKTVENLTTKISNLKFSPSGRFLFMATPESRNGIRVLELESGRIMKNWPTLSPSLGRIQAFDLDQAGKMLVVGNSKGTCFKFDLLE